MANPFLTRPIWLNAEERKTLKDAAEKIIATTPEEAAHWFLVLDEIEGVSFSLQKLAQIKHVVVGLHLAETARPVFLCDADINFAVTKGGLDPRIATLLSPPPRTRLERPGRKRRPSRRAPGHAAATS